MKWLQFACYLTEEGFDCTSGEYNEKTVTEECFS